MLRELLLDVCANYSAARTEDFAKHPMAGRLRSDLPAAVEAALGEELGDLIVAGSPGQGVWADVPWVAIFDPSVTTSAMRGYYPVYLFDPARQQLHLSLNQGTTSVRLEFASQTRDVLGQRAELMRGRVNDFAHQLATRSIDLVGGGLARDYTAGHAAGLTYDVHSLPDNTALASDVKLIVAAYRALTFRGGLDFGELTGSDLAVGEVQEQRKYRMHRRIERNRKTAALVKAHHGYTCQSCGFDFAARYGDLGKEFIEVHYLTPLAALAEGVSVTYNVSRDFAVLCANCHRMIHRLPNESDLAGLRQLLQ